MRGMLVPPAAPHQQALVAPRCQRGILVAQPRAVVVAPAEQDRDRQGSLEGALFIRWAALPQVPLLEEMVEKAEPDRKVQAATGEVSGMGLGVIFGAYRIIFWPE